ncbi:MAG: Amuc_1100 family pilus-like protein, partial [Verrucomicrobiota bacterium]|nr:Amuc_1100 family pilus-like protein [Verrucomicrobiota bacterium]
FLAILGVATLAAFYFIWSEMSSFDQAKAVFDQNATQLNRLQALAPFPNEANVKKMKTQAEDYAAELTKLKEGLKTRVLPQVPMAPNEFQARLRQAVTSLNEKARANKVKMPDNFFLGFEEYAAALPDDSSAKVLGQQVAQAELLVNILLDARVESITTFRRIPPVAPAPTPAIARKPGTAPAAPLIERAVIEVAFTYKPGGARRALNQIASNAQQFYIVRTLHVLNDKDKGPPREVAGATAAASGSPTPAANTALNFIVGNEHLQTTARIEMLRFNF